MEKKGIPYGSLWGIFLLNIYFYLFITLGLYLVWNHTAWPTEWKGWLATIGSSFVFLLSGIILFIPTFAFAFYLMIKDRDFNELRWPIGITILYWILPIPVPGPVDETGVFTFSYLLKTKILPFIQAKFQEKVSNLNQDQIENQSTNIEQNNTTFERYKLLVNGMKVDGNIHPSELKLILNMISNSKLNDLEKKELEDNLKNEKIFSINYESISNNPIESIKLISELIELFKIDKFIHTTEKIFLFKIGQILNIEKKDIEDLLN